MRRKNREVTEHCGFEDVPLDTCRGLSAVRIYRITLDDITGKRNLPGSESKAFQVVS